MKIKLTNKLLFSKVLFLATAFFIPGSHSDPAEMIHGIHKALIALGILTILSTTVFGGLKSGDGDDLSLHKVLHPEG